MHKLLLLLAALVGATPALAQNATEELFRQGVAPDQPEELRAYLRVFPQGTLAAEARRLLGAAVATPPLDAAQAILLAAASLRRISPAAPLGAVDTGSGEQCTLTPGSLFVVLQQAGTPEAPTLQLRVAIAQPASCPAASRGEVPMPAMEATLRAFGREFMARPLRAEARPDELAEWAASGAARDPVADADHLARFPASPFAELAAARLLAALRLQTFPPPPAPALAPAPAPAPPAAAALSPEQAEGSLGLTRERWAGAQRALGALNFDAGEPDGLPGPRTRQAVLAFQRGQRLPETGYLDSASLARLEEVARGPLAALERRRADQARADAADAERRRAEVARAEAAEAERRRNTRWASVERDNRNKFYRYISSISEQDARAQARRLCENDPDSTQCIHTTAFTNACFALARNQQDGSGWGWAYAATMAEAQQKAMTSCQGQNPSCSVSWNWCAQP